MSECSPVCATSRTGPALMASPAPDEMWGDVSGQREEGDREREREGQVPGKHGKSLNPAASFLTN